MKALLQIAIQIDLDKIVDESSLEALLKYTGAQSKAGVGKFYMDSLVKSIIDDNLRKEHIAYSVEGNIVDEEMAQDENVQDESNSEDISAYNLVDVANGETEPTQESIDIEDIALTFMEQVSVHKGLPKTLYITAELFDKFISDVNRKSESRPNEFLVAELVWRGIKVVRTDEEYVMAIDYASYSGSSIETEYLRTLAKTL